MKPYIKYCKVNWLQKMFTLIDYSKIDQRFRSNSIIESFQHLLNFEQCMKCSLHKFSDNLTKIDKNASE